MNALFEQKIDEWIDEYCEEKRIERLWKKPVVRFADAKGFPLFLDHVLEGHTLPEELLPGATLVLSYFLPFLEFVAKSNWEGSEPSDLWARAYLSTNTMAVTLNERIQEEVESMGYRAAIPLHAGVFAKEVLKSKWSQRHVAWLAGHGTFGINNMLISDKGSCGRYFSVVTTLDVEAGKPMRRERCLYKRNGSCGICVKRCPVGAFEGEYDRFKCYEWLKKNEKYEGAEVCGKCDVKLPCSHWAT